MNSKNPIPVLLGADLNAYSVARAFHEYTGSVSYAFGRYRCGITSFSRIVKAQTIRGLDDITVAGPALFDFAKKHKGKRLLLIPCADHYIEIGARISERLSDYYCSVIPSKEHREMMGDKVSFYKLLDDYKIPYPEYIKITSADGAERVTAELGYPLVIKPANSAEYWRCEFSGMKKVYFPESADEALKIIERIYSSEYKGALILQKRIGGSEPEISVLTTYSDRSGRVVRAVLGKVILEETGDTSYGNHAAIITTPLTPLAKKLIKLLEEVKYTGIANFDIISDGKQDYVLEVNLRQGRSSDYLRGAGVNLAELMIRDINGEKIERDFEYEKVYWHYPPHRTVLAAATRVGAKEAEALRHKGVSSAPLYYEPDFISNPRRRIYVSYHDKRLARSFSSRARR